MKRKSCNFLELLVAAALISLLAIMSIPHFSWADVDFKIQQTHRELRAIGIALEAYHIDHNMYPPDGYATMGYPAIPEGAGYWSLNHTLTTPVPYLTKSYLIDPFNTGQATESIPWWDNYRYVNYPWSYRDYRLFYDMDPLPGDFLDRYLQLYGDWVVISLGPDGLLDFGSNQMYDDLGILWSSAVPYDPTNGTFSRGDIVYSYHNYREDFPVADFIPSPAAGVVPLEVRFWDRSQGVISQWAWDFGDGNSGEGQNPVHTYQEAGEHTVILEVSGVGGVDTKEMVITTIEADKEYHAGIVSFTIPALLQGEHNVMTLTVQNLGTGTWLKDENIYLGAVDNHDPIAKYLRIGLLEDVTPAQLYTFTIEVQPQEAGTFTTEWQMLREGEFWFGEIFSREVEVFEAEPPTGVERRFWRLIK